MTELLYIPSGKYVKFFLTVRLETVRGGPDTFVRRVPASSIEEYVRGSCRAGDYDSKIAFTINRLLERKFGKTVYESADIPTGQLVSEEFELVRVP